MKNTVRAIAIIRDRGQLTIPDKIRAVTPWLKLNAVINITVYPDKIILRPYGINPKAQVPE